MNRSHPRVIATVRVKNESWILEPWLQRTCEYADGIIAINDASTDDSARILRACPKTLIVVDNPPGQRWDELRDRNRLINEARRLGAQWVHIIDPDEIMDARLADRIDDLTADHSVGRYFFREVSLWRSTQHYRADRPDQYGRPMGTNQLVRVTPQLVWTTAAQFRWTRMLRMAIQTRQLPRAPKVGHQKLLGLRGKTVCDDELVRLHYHFADWDRTWLVHMRYAVTDAIEMRRKPNEVQQVISWATSRMDETGLRLEPVRPEWGVLPLPGAKSHQDTCTPCPQGHAQSPADV